MPDIAYAGNIDISAVVLHVIPNYHTFYVLPPIWTNLRDIVVVNISLLVKLYLYDNSIRQLSSF